MTKAFNAIAKLSGPITDIAALRLQTWVSSRRPDEIVLVSNYTPGDAGGRFRLDAADTTTADDGALVIVDAAGSRWKRQWDGMTAFAAWWGAVASTSVNQAPAIQAAINWFEARGDLGGTVVLPIGEIRIESTLLVQRSNINLLGQGGDFIHDGGTGADAATKLSWYGAAGGTIIEFTTPSGVGNSKRNGGGLQNVELDCRAIAAYGLVLYSWNSGRFHHIHVLSPTTAAYFLFCRTTGVDIAEAGDNQYNEFERCSFRCLAPGSTNANGFLLGGSTNANTSVNTFRNCTGQHHTGHGWLFFNADNNQLTQCSSFRVTGNGYSFYFCGTRTATVGGGYSQTLLHCRWDATYGVYVEGTEVSPNTAGPAYPNTFIGIDNANGSQPPTYGTGVERGICSFDIAYVEGMEVARGGFGEGPTQANAAKANRASGTAVHVYSTNEGHLVLDNGTDVWAIRIVAATGNLSLERIAGSGKLALPDPTLLLTGGFQVSVGANDSGGVGFRLLRIPN